MGTAFNTQFFSEELIRGVLDLITMAPNVVPINNFVAKNYACEIYFWIITFVGM